ncbi:hypothetical protein [Sporosarcina sp. Te-1]|uniref:hypothetical protein n=1 Tax=Sporosarcina sp. Te-1 TaxID=2818390 RepID=UPI001A9F779A|nr:hypothetical protein [Sporosarcina sp. Te-1]QTD40062.1 hypothetical protein J3U78_14685 [Sporosarcina sp. Te-1]
MEQKVKEAVNAIIGEEPELKRRITSNQTKQNRKSRLVSNRFNPVVIAFLLIVGSVSFYFLSALPDRAADGEDTPVLIEKEATIERKLLEDSAAIFSYLENNELAKLAEKVDPIEGVTFTIFADFTKTNNYGGTPVTLTRDELVRALDKQFVWGHDDSEQTLEATFRDYVHEYLLKRQGDTINYETITFNESAFVFPGVLNTIHKNYPKAIYVEYYAPGENEDERLFQSIRFVFQERDGTWYLIGIVRDVATG